MKWLTRHPPENVRTSNCAFSIIGGGPPKVGYGINRNGHKVILMAKPQSGT